MRALKSRHWRWGLGLCTPNTKTVCTVSYTKSKSYVGYVYLHQWVLKVCEGRFVKTKQLDISTKSSMTLCTECSLLVGAHSTVSWNNLKGVQHACSKTVLWCEPTHCKWRELGVQLQNCTPDLSWNAQFLNNDSQVELAKIWTSGLAQLIISDAFVIWCHVCPWTTR